MCMLAMKHNLSLSAADDFIEIFNLLKSKEEDSVRSMRSIWNFIDKAYNLKFEETGKVAIIPVSQKFPNVSDVRFYFEDPITLIEELVMDPKLTEMDSVLLGFDLKHSKMDGRVFGELNSGVWMESACRWIDRNGFSDVLPLPIIFYSDGTNCDRLGRVSVKPVYMQLGLHNYSTRCKPQSRRLVCYMPEPASTKWGEDVDMQAKHFVYHQCWKALVNALYSFRESRQFLEYNLPNGIGAYKFYPLICFWMMDHPEQMKMCSIKDGSTRRPCHTCEIPLEKMSDPSDISKLRRYKETDERRQHEDSCNEFSLYNETPCINSYLIGSLGVYSSKPPCRLHLYDLGLVSYCKDWIVQIIKDYAPPKCKGKTLLYLILGGMKFHFTHQALRLST